MIQGVSDITFENFQNPENTHDDIFEEMETEEFMNTATKANPPNNNSNSDSNSDSDSDMDEDDIENLDNANNIDSEDSIIQEEEDNKTNKKLKTTNPEYKKSKFANIEGFQGSQIQLYWNRNLLLKCILFGILFYVLSSPKTYALTNQYLPSNIDRVLLHSILYTFIIFVIYQII